MSRTYKHIEQALDKNGIRSKNPWRSKAYLISCDRYNYDFSLHQDVLLKTKEKIAMREMRRDIEEILQETL